MSVTIGFVPLALLYGAGLGLSALMETCSAQSVPKNVLEENTRCGDQLHRLLYPNLNAARQSVSGRAEQSESQGFPCFVRKTFVQDMDFARKAVESLGGREETIAEGGAFFLDGNAVLVLNSGSENECELWMIGGLNESDAANLATRIEDEYKRIVRDHVHEALLRRSAEFGLQLESEEIQSDQSVVLTFTV